MSRPATFDLAPEHSVAPYLGPQRSEEKLMAWETPIVTEIAVGMEVTSYLPGEDEVLP
jgi:coenzyme PQQ precursor peptide PqqA